MGMGDTCGCFADAANVGLPWLHRVRFRAVAGMVAKSASRSKARWYPASTSVQRLRMMAGTWATASRSWRSVVRMPCAGLWRCAVLEQVNPVRLFARIQAQCPCHRVQHSPERVVVAPLPPI